MERGGVLKAFTTTSSKLDGSEAGSSAELRSRDQRSAVFGASQEESGSETRAAPPFPIRFSSIREPSSRPSETPP
jgi:hypothetical protein